MFNESIYTRVQVLYEELVTQDLPNRVLYSHAKEYMMSQSKNILSVIISDFEFVLNSLVAHRLDTITIGISIELKSNRRKFAGVVKSVDDINALLLPSASLQYHLINEKHHLNLISQRPVNEFYRCPIQFEIGLQKYRDELSIYYLEYRSLFEMTQKMPYTRMIDLRYYGKT